MRRQLEGERFNLDCGRRTPQLKRNPLGGHMSITAIMFLALIALGIAALIARVIIAHRRSPENDNTVERGPGSASLP